MMKNKVDLKQFEWVVFVIVMVVLFSLLKHTLVQQTIQEYIG